MLPASITVALDGAWTRLAVSAALAAAAFVLLAPAPEALAQRDLWATVNACDTERHPNQVGLRGSMPGNGTRQRMYMRFQVQYFNEGAQGWANVEGSGRSPWVLAGSARFKSRQAGYTFAFQPPEGGRYVLRGVVEFAWRVRRPRGRRTKLVTVTRREEVTKGGRPAANADPPGYSNGVCEIR